VNIRSTFYSDRHVTGEIYSRYLVKGRSCLMFSCFFALRFYRRVSAVCHIQLCLASQRLHQTNNEGERTVRYLRIWHANAHLCPLRSGFWEERRTVASRKNVVFELVTATLVKITDPMFTGRVFAACQRILLPSSAVTTSQIGFICQKTNPMA